MQYRNIDKQALKENGYTVLSKITIVGTDTVFTEDDYIVDWDYEDYRFVPNTGFIGQFVERILDGNLQNISDGVILEDTEINLKLGIKNALDNNTITWYDYGNFLITKVEKTDTTGNYRFESADYTKKFNKVFNGNYTDTTYMKSFNEKIEDGETVTALWLAQYVCKQAGVVLNDTNFTNYDFIISSNQYDSGDTLRKVMQDIGKLAYSWVRVGEDNKVHIDFTPKTTSSVDQYDQLTTDEYYVSKKSDLAFGPVNKVLIGMSDVEGENLYETSEDYTPETECAIKIYDNNLTNTEELRALALDGCDRLFGIEYTPIEINSVGHPWLDGDELIKLTNVDGEIIYTYPFNRKIHYAGYIEGVIGAEASTSQNSEYEYKSDIISNVKRTSIIVDKQEQIITALAENVDDNTSDISQMQIDLNGIDLRVQSVESTEVTGVVYEYAKNTSDTEAPTTGWSTTAPTRDEGEYIWARIKTTYKTGSPTYSDPVCTTGDKGDTGQGVPGQDGKGIISVTPLYYCSNSNSTPNKPNSHVTTSSLTAYNTWNIKCANYTTTYKYYFTCSEIKYTDNSYAWTDVVADQSVMFVNNLQVGGRNLLRNTKTFKPNGTSAASALNGWCIGSGITLNEGSDGFSYLSRTTTTDYFNCYNLILYETVKNKDITISFEYKNSVETQMNAFISLWLKDTETGNRTGYHDYTITFPVATEWTKSSLTYHIDESIFTSGTITGNEIYFVPAIYFRTADTSSSPSTTFQLRKLKVELGNIATDWSPAPEDTESKIPDTIVGTQTTNTRFWTGVASFTELQDGQEIMYWNPRSTASSTATTQTTGVDMRVDASTTKTAGTLISSFEGNVSNVWLNLTLPNNTETGWIPCYYGGTSRLTTHYDGGKNIHLTYKVNANVAGVLYTGWFADANYDSNNTDRIRFQNNIKADQMYLNSSRLIVAINNGNYIELNRNCSFRIDKPILMTGSNINILGTNNNTYLMFSSIPLSNNLYNSNFENANITLGSSQVWGRGTALAGTGTNKTGYAGAVGDHYTNSSSGYVYECKTAGTASTAKWDYVKTTAKTAGKKWYGGTILSGTGTNKTGYAGTVGDYYWNNSSGTYYYCTTTGTSSTAKWDYVGVLTKAYETLYLRGTLEGDIFTVADVPFIAGIPETPDDLYYIVIGSMYSVTHYGLFPEHPIYKFVNGEFKSLNQVAYDAHVATDVINNSLSNYVTTTTYNADWQNRKDEIYSYVGVNYTTTSDFGTYQETMQTALSQKADATTISATATQIVNDAISGIQETVSNIEETFTFNTNGLTIARSGNTMYLQLQNDRLSFRTDNTTEGERAYMTSNAFVLKELTQFQIGNFKFEVRTNGSLDFKKV